MINNECFAPFQVDHIFFNYLQLCTEKIEARAPLPKKPKHLKRKLEAALQENDNVALEKIRKENEELAKFKYEAAKKFKKTCRKLVIQFYGEAKWSSESFDRLIDTGLTGKALLKQLGISRNQQKKLKVQSLQGGKSSIIHKNSHRSEKLGEDSVIDCKIKSTEGGQMAKRKKTK